MKKKAFVLIVEGRVQGVGFRYFTMKAAKKLSIYGYVKNMHDGNVYIYAEGDEKKLESFITKCSDGPIFSKVTKVQISPSNITGYDNFSIR